MLADDSETMIIIALKVQNWGSLHGLKLLLYYSNVLYNSY